MYENMVDVLIYLYENYMDGEGQPPVDQSELEDELAQAGFSNPEIEKALRWLDELAAQPRDIPIPSRYRDQALSLGRDLASDPTSVRGLTKADTGSSTCPPQL